MHKKNKEYKQGLYLAAKITTNYVWNSIRKRCPYLWYINSVSNI